MATKFEERVGQPVTAEVLIGQLTRLEAAFGKPKDRAEDMVRVMANEWLKALSGFGANSLRQAIDKLIRTWVPSFGRTWPSIAEVHALCVADHDGWRDALGLKPDGGRLEDHTGRGREPFEREGRTTEEEIAYRATQVKELHARYAYTPALDYEPSDTIEPAKPALADDGHVSSALEAHARKHGYWTGAEA